MCSIGWLKLKNSVIFFKQRDRLTGGPMKNTKVKDGNIFAFGDETFGGIWVGMNKHFFIACSYGGTLDVPEGYKPEFFELMEKILRNCNSVDEAVKKYIEFYEKDKVGRPCNTIIADNNKAVSLEVLSGHHSIEEHNNMIVKTNSFEKLTGFNTAAKMKIEMSKARKEKIMELLKKSKNVEDIKNMLMFHGKLNGICRHDYCETIASCIFELKDGKLKVFYVLNGYPHEGGWKEEEVKFK